MLNLLKKTLLLFSLSFFVYTPTYSSKDIGMNCYIADISDIEFYHLEWIDLEKKARVDQFLDSLYDKISKFSEQDQLRYYSLLNEKIILWAFLNGNGPISFNWLKTPLVRYTYYKMRSDIYSKQINLCNEYKVVVGRIDSSFPQYLDIDITSKNKPKKPQWRNISDIYFQPENSNSRKIQDSSYTIEWLISADVEKIEVIWDGDNDSYFLKNFTSDTPDFSYNISTKLWNLNNGTNKYLIRGYAEKYIYERVMKIDYFSPDIVKILERESFPIEDIQDKNITWKYLLSEKTNKYTEYILGLNYGVTKFQLSDYSVEFYNNPKQSYGEYSGNYIKVFDKQNRLLSEINNNRFSYDTFSLPTLRAYKSGHLEFSIGWHEAPTTYYYYNARMNTFIHMHKFMNQNFDDDYGVNLFIKPTGDNSLFIQSFVSRWQQEWTNYSFELDLNTMNITNIKKDIKQLEYEDYFF